jgi:4'-phosphopantetheinyl transferase
VSAVFLRVESIRLLAAQIPANSDAWLSPSEQTRLAGLHIEKRRLQYLAGHWLARCLLAQAVGAAPETLLLDERPDLPPAASAHPDWQISLSHSGDWIACALAEHAVGVDIEQRETRAALLKFQDLLLAQDEAPGTLDGDALLARWVAKEAWIKQHHLSALPEQLRAVRLKAATSDQFEVQIWTHARWHLGLAMACGHAPLDELGFTEQIEARRFWRVL